jgi:hypothetical protein
MAGQVGADAVAHDALRLHLWRAGADQEGAADFVQAGGGVEGHGGLLRKKAVLFLKKKNQKNFHPFASMRHGCKVRKVFWFFFSKKNILAY